MLVAGSRRRGPCERKRDTLTLGFALRILAHDIKLVRRPLISTGIGGNLRRDRFRRLRGSRLRRGLLLGNARRRRGRRRWCLDLTVRADRQRTHTP